MRGIGFRFSAFVQVWIFFVLGMSTARLASAECLVLSPLELVTPAGAYSMGRDGLSNYLPRVAIHQPPPPIPPPCTYRFVATGGFIVGLPTTDDVGPPSPSGAGTLSWAAHVLTVDPRGEHNISCVAARRSKLYLLINGVRQPGFVTITQEPNHVDQPPSPYAGVCPSLFYDRIRATTPDRSSPPPVKTKAATFGVRG
jgi:hypothetical protein